MHGGPFGPGRTHPIPGWIPVFGLQIGPPPPMDEIVGITADVRVVPAITALVGVEPAITGEVRVRSAIRARTRVRE